MKRFIPLAICLFALLNVEPGLGEGLESPAVSALSISGPQPTASLSKELIEAQPPRLTGVILALGVRLALFASPSGAVVTVNEGGSIGTYHVKTITSNGVVLSDGLREKRLLITEDNRLHGAITSHAIHATDPAAN